MGNTQEKYDDLLRRYSQWMEVERGNSQIAVYQMINHTKRFLRWLDERDMNVESIDQCTLNEYISECKSVYSSNSLVPITSNLKKFLVFFLKKDLNVRVRRMTSPEREKTPFTREEVQEMFNKAKDDRLAEAVLKTLYYSGVRKSELINLDIRDVDFKRLQLVIRHGKGDIRRTINITQDCAMAIQRWLMQRPKPKAGYEEALFISSHRQRISKTYVQETVKKYAAMIGIRRNVYPHLFRVTMITHMAEHGCSPKEIQAQSGHKDYKTLLGYIQHTSSRIRKAYDEVFEDEQKVPATKSIDMLEHSEQYKKMIIQKYLHEDISLEMMNMMLKTFEGETQEEKKENKDIAYI